MGGKIIKIPFYDPFSNYLGEGYSDGKFQDSVAFGKSKPLGRLDNVGRDHDTDSALATNDSDLYNADIKFIKSALLTFDPRAPLYSALVATNFVRRPLIRMWNDIPDTGTAQSAKSGQWVGPANQKLRQRNVNYDMNKEITRKRDVAAGVKGVSFDSTFNSGLYVPKVLDWQEHEGSSANIPHQPVSDISSQAQMDDKEQLGSGQFPWARARNFGYYPFGGKNKRKKKKNRVYVN